MSPQGTAFLLRERGSLKTLVFNLHSNLGLFNLKDMIFFQCIQLSNYQTGKKDNLSGDEVKINKYFKNQCAWYKSIN